MELTELVRVAVLEDIKKNARDFLGKDDYKLGDISKTLDARVKVRAGGECVLTIGCRGRT